MATLAEAHDALAAGSWELAMTLFAAAARETGDPRAFEGQAQAAWWLDDADRSIGARSAAYRRYRDLGDDLGAGRAATALAWDSQLFGQGDAVALGWLQRAHDLLDPLEVSDEHGWLAVREAELALGVLHDPARARASARQAASVGRGTGTHELVVVAEALEGLALASEGDLSTGMPLLDSAVAAATAGDVADLMWLGKVCCWLIVACQEARDLDRAQDWCRRVEQLCVERGLEPLFNTCRISYAGIQIARGTWSDADRELTAALARLDRSHRTTRLGAVVALGELRRRQGRDDEAASLFAQAEFAPGSVVGRALMRRDAGDAGGAARSLGTLLAEMPDDGRLARAAVLAPLVDVALSAGRLDLAASAARELRTTAVAVGTGPLLAAAALADASLALVALEDDVRAATCAREAVRRFHESGLRYDEAEARLVLARVLARLGDLAGAQEHVDLARETFAELGASGMAVRAAAVLGAQAPRPSVLTEREEEVLRLVADGLSNRAIADRLTLSEHTVHRHVANILAKLGQSTRTGAVAYALQTGLL